MRKVLMRAAVLLSCGLSAASADAAKATHPIEIASVVLVAYEVGKDTGDFPGELQAWADTIPRTLPFPAGERGLRYDPGRKLLVLLTGVGTNRAATAVMALGSDPRFDLRRAYWLVAGGAGVNPHTASVGSAAWIGDIVDTDYAFAIDAREIPADWPVGIFPLDRHQPYEAPRGDATANLFPLNKGLRDWAYNLTAHVALPDSVDLATLRAGFRAYPKAMCPPSVIMGDEATGQTFWKGQRYNDHTMRWVRYWTGKEGSFVMTAMESSGIARALSTLGKMGTVAPDRLMVMRTGMNYTVQPEGKTAAQSLQAESMNMSAYKPALAAAFRLGTIVVDEIAQGWAQYRGVTPVGAPPQVAQPTPCS